MSSTSPPTNSSTAPTIRQLAHAMAIGARVTVVTPNRRLALYLKRQFDVSQQLAGSQAWATPDILPFSTFLERSYRALNLRGNIRAQAQILDAAQCQLLWEQVVRMSEDSSYLLSVTRAASQAAAAWSLAQMWELLPAMRRLPLPEDAAVFLGWAQRFGQFCRERAVIDAAVLPTALTAALEEQKICSEVMPQQLLVAGFDIVTPQQRRFFAACDRLGVSVQHVQAWEVASEIHPQCRRAEFASEASELRSCAVWARQHLQANPTTRIGIVVPDLRARHGDVVHALTDALNPGQRAVSLRPDAAGFNISLGLGLNEYALVHDAISLIAFSQNRSVPFLDVSTLLRSPFIAGAKLEMGARVRLDGALRGVVAPEISLFALQRKLKIAGGPHLMRAAAACPTLTDLIDRVANVGGTSLSDTPRVRRPSPRDWSRHFGKVLLAWGFPGDAKLGSADFQVLEKFREALDTLATLDAVQPRMRADEALNHLRSIVANTVFQPEIEANIHAPIQVLGILESAGQTFDALWVTGLSEDAWPLIARPNPFIPAALQRAAGVTEASAAASLALDQRITAAWRHCAAEVVFSHAITGENDKAGGQPRAASALTRDVPPADFTALIDQSASLEYARALFALRQLESVPDKPMLVLPTPTTVAGGTAVLRDQAACPFRAFARHRLGASALGIPETGLDAAERGTLLHRVLSLLWARLQTQAQLTAMNETARQNLVSSIVERAISEAHAAGMDNLIGRFATIEQARLVRLVVDWLVYELERAPFEVVACEQARDVVLSGLSMRLRLDRLDRLTDGTFALIDYKTGAAKVASWIGERPDEPQLPLYFQTAGQTISVLAFARVKRGARGKVFGFEGVSAVENLLPDVAPIETKFGMEKRGYSSWDVLTAEWERSLGALVNNFIRGDASVDPKNGRLTCAQCDLHGLCRIREAGGMQMADDDGDAVADAAAEGPGGASDD